MKRSIKQISLSSLFLLISIFSGTSLAAETEFKIRADGLACPYCAYGIEKKFKQIDGVEDFDIDLKQGLVTVTGKENLDFSEEQLTLIEHPRE